MKLLAICLMMMLSTSVEWLGDFDVAKKEATDKHKMILINFSGSDWCGPCIRLRKEILETPAFESYAAEHLVLVRADFPRQKKNQLSKDQVKKNEKLADQYNSEGKFPYTLLLDDQGKVIKSWDGFPNETPDQFIADIKKFEANR